MSRARVDGKGQLVRPPALPWKGGCPPSEPLAPRTRLAADILERCRGEGPANCVGRCPLNVDARAYVQLAGQRRFGEALQKVREKLPFPGVLGYLCSHPCELACKKIDEDAAIRVRDIKRFLAAQEVGPPRHLVDKELPRAEKVAVVGSGPSGLMAAHDLSLKGYKIALLEREASIGGSLTHKIPEYRLPSRVTERDLSIIDALGIEVHTGVALGEDVGLDALRESYDAVVLCLGYEGGLELMGRSDGFGTTACGTLSVDPMTLETAIPRVFIAGDATSGPSTVIQSMALGRRAAESAHRMLQKRDMREGRTLPIPPRLLWKLEVDETQRRARERTPIMLTPFNDAMTEREVVEESERCLDCSCSLCIEDCEFLAKYCEKSPRELARRIEAGVDVSDTLRISFSCNLCSLCSRVCPEHLDTGEMLLAARREAHERIGPRPQHRPVVGYWKAGVSAPLSLIMPEPGRHRAKRLFFTGCALPSLSSRNTIAVYNELRRDFPGTGVMMLCCSAPIKMIGMEEEHGASVEQLRRMAESVGAEELLPACPDCAHMLGESLPDFKIKPVWEYLADKWSPPRQREGVTVAVHDPCKAAGMPGLHEAVRTLIGRSGAGIQEIEYSRDRARCCGFGGIVQPVDAELTQKVSRRRASESRHPMVTYCASCSMALGDCGKQSLHILDFIYSDDWERKASAPAPGTMSRYAHRLLTKWRFKRLKPLTK